MNQCITGVNTKWMGSHWIPSKLERWLSYRCNIQRMGLLYFKGLGCYMEKNLYSIKYQLDKYAGEVKSNEYFTISEIYIKAFQEFHSMRRAEIENYYDILENTLPNVHQ